MAAGDGRRRRPGADGVHGQLKGALEYLCPVTAIAFLIGVVVLIVGDYTARVGDPSGRSALRPQLTGEQIDAK